MIIRELLLCILLLYCSSCIPKDKVCIMNKDTIYNCNNIPILVFDNPKNTSVRGIRDLESGVFFPLQNLSEKEDEMLKEQMRDLYYKSMWYDACVMSSFHYIVTLTSQVMLKIYTF